MAFDGIAFALSCALFAICISTVVYLKLRDVSPPGGLVTILAAPIIFYMVLSGTVTEIGGLGFEAKLRDTAQIQVDPVQIDRSDVLGADALDTPLDRNVLLGKASHVVALDGDAWMGLESSGRSDIRDRQGLLIATSIYQSLLSGGFRGLLVTDRHRRPLGFFEASYFTDLLRIPLDRVAVSSDARQFVLSDDEIIARVKETNLASILLNPPLRAQIEGNKIWKRFDTPALDLLDAIQKNRLDTVVLVDFRGEYVGVVPRERVVDTLLRGLFRK